MQSENDDLFLFSRETLNKIAALSEQKKKDFFKGWITSSSITFIANGVQDWSYNQVVGLAEKLKKVRPVILSNIAYCECVVRNDWIKLREMRGWDHSVGIREPGKAVQYFNMNKLLEYRANPEKFELIKPYAEKEARYYQTLKIDEVIRTVCEYRAKFENDRSF